MPRRRGAVRRVAGRLVRLAALAALAAAGWAAAYAAIDPPTTLLIETERRRLGGVERAWRPLEAISPHLARAVVAAEDARFCSHPGFDLDAIRQALSERARGRIRGASTITQQVAKNAFLWPAPHWTRKALEAGFAVLIEAFWSKRRILEVYLNIAEMGEGVFGAEAAARHWFGKGAEALTLSEAARIAAILPAPRSRSARSPGAFTARRAAAIAEGARTIAARGDDACLALR
jgi:monofunctional biosynthetic peptidoglycan transglycosylase